jgi:nitrite reductase/ring-hydroxylating ferredoxin subunit
MTDDFTTNDDVRRDDCGGCELGRRAFLRDAAGAVAAALLLLGARKAEAASMTLAYMTPARVAGSERTYPLPVTDGATIDRDAEVILMRWQGNAYAFALSCPHQNTALRWLERDGRFQCPKHKSKYRPDGTFIEGRATRAMDRYGVRRSGQNVVVDLAVLHQRDKDPAGWDAAVVVC